MAATSDETSQGNGQMAVASCREGCFVAEEAESGRERWWALCLYRRVWRCRLLWSVMGEGKS